MKNKTIRKAGAALMAALSLSCSAVLPAFAHEHRGSFHGQKGRPAASDSASEQIMGLGPQDCGEEVDRYSIWPGCEYIVAEYYSGPGVLIFSRARVTDRYEEYHTFIFIEYSFTMVDYVDLATGKTYTVNCDKATFYYPN